MGDPIPIIRAKNGEADYFILNPVEHWMKAYEHGPEKYDVLAVALNNSIHCAKVIYRRCPELLHRISKASGYNVLHHAVLREDNPSLLKFVISVADRELYRMSDAWKNTPFTMSIEHNRFHAFELMAEADPDLLSYVDVRLMTPLLRVQECRGSEHDKGKFRKFILEKQPYSSLIRLDHGWGALHHAASKGDVGAIQDIIRFCPETVHVVDNEGKDFADIAIKFGHSKMVKKVLQRKEIWDNILKGNNIQGIEKLRTFLHLERTLSEREKELRIPPEHVVLYRELVDQFGEIVDPSKFMEEGPTPMYEALGCFLSDVSEMVDIQPGQEDKISNWEKMAAKHSAMGLQISWLQNLIARYSHWSQHVRHLEDGIATKTAAFATKQIKIQLLEEELKVIDTELKDLQEQRSTYTPESDPLFVIWQIISK